MEANASVPVSSTMKMKKNQNVGVFSACLDVEARQVLRSLGGGFRVGVLGGFDVGFGGTEG